MEAACGSSLCTDSHQLPLFSWIIFVFSKNKVDICRQQTTHKTIAKTMKRLLCTIATLLLATAASWSTTPLKMGNPKPKAQLPVMETGGQKMPDEWIDKDTGHHIIRLTRRSGNNKSFYFNNNPFVGDEMIFGGSKSKKAAWNWWDNDRKGPWRQMFAIDLNTLKIRQITDERYPVNTEIVCPATHELFFQRADTVFSINIDNCRRRIVSVLPMRGAINCVNCNGTLLAGKLDDPAEENIARKHPGKTSFDAIYAAKLKRTLFILDTKTGVMDTIFSDRAWLNHLQFSPTDPSLLMFCHEGPWQDVDRIWTINVRDHQAPKLIHKRTMYREIAGHEWFGASGRYIYFDLQKPRSVKFYVGKVDVRTGAEQDTELPRSAWSVHYNTSWDERFLVGDGGSPTSVAHSPEDQWIDKFTYDGDHFKVERLVNMKHHNYYKLEPNVHVSPDDRWVIFRANFEGHTDVYAVEL
jgi:oligogalacturonide lyase